MQAFAQLLLDHREALIAKWEAIVLADPDVPRAAEIAEPALRDHVTLTAALRELSHLRCVLVDFWWQHEGLDSRGVRMVHAAIDECMTAATAHMEQVTSTALR